MLHFKSHPDEIFCFFFMSIVLSRKYMYGLRQIILILCISKEKISMTPLHKRRSQPLLLLLLLLLLILWLVFLPFLSLFVKNHIIHPHMHPNNLNPRKKKKKEITRRVPIAGKHMVAKQTTCNKIITFHRSKSLKKGWLEQFLVNLFWKAGFFWSFSPNKEMEFDWSRRKVSCLVLGVN